MRLLTITDLVAAVGLFAIGSAAACSGDTIAILAIRLAVGAAVGWSAQNRCSCAKAQFWDAVRISL
jgi:hypothetical protein